MHRPYQAQKIAALFARYIDGDAGQLFDAASKMRNALAHGDPLAEIEQSVGKKLSEVLDDVARLAWTALLDSLLKASSLQGRVRLRLLQPSSFLHYMLTHTVEIQGGFAPNGNPSFADIPSGIHVDLVPVDDANQAPERGEPEPSPYVITEPLPDVDGEPR